MSLTIVGTIAFDSIRTPNGYHDRLLGGSATYAGIAASLFSKVHLVSIVGQDFPESQLDFLNQRGISTEGVQRHSGNTFFWKGYYEGDMNQAFTETTELNVLLDFDPVIPETAKSDDIVFLANFDPVLQLKAIRQFKAPKLIILDSMNFWIEHHTSALKETLKKVDVLILNDLESRQLAQTSTTLQAMKKLIQWGPKRIIVKKGEHGAVMYNGQEFFVCPAYPLVDNIVDPTGAGDSFAGSFAGYLSQKNRLCEADFRQAVVVGTLVSSHTLRNFSVDALKNITPEQLNQQYTLYKETLSVPSVVF